MGGTFKPRTRVGDRTAWDWQRPNLPDQVTVVAPSSEARLLDADWFNFDGRGGPVNALAHVLPHLDSDGPLVVCYADTLFFGHLPPGDWVGVAEAEGGRIWDYHLAGTFWMRGHVAPETWREVCIGLYQFTDLDLLGFMCKQTLADTAGEAHMWSVANKLRCRAVPFEWFDVGDPAAVTAAVKGLTASGRLQ